MYIVVSRSSGPNIQVHCSLCSHFLSWIVSFVRLQPMSAKHADKHRCDKNRRENETFYAIESVLVRRCTNPRPNLFVSNEKGKMKPSFGYRCCWQCQIPDRQANLQWEKNNSNNISKVEGDGMSNNVTSVYAFERVAN